MILLNPSSRRKTLTNHRCMNCLQYGHYTYSCRGETQYFLNGGQRDRDRDRQNNKENIGILTSSSYMNKQNQLNSMNSSFEDISNSKQSKDNFENLSNNQILQKMQQMTQNAQKMADFSLEAMESELPHYNDMLEEEVLEDVEDIVGRVKRSRSNSSISDQVLSHMDHNFQNSNSISKEQVGISNSVTKEQAIPISNFESKELAIEANKEIQEQEQVQNVEITQKEDITTNECEDQLLVAEDIVVTNDQQQS